MRTRAATIVCMWAVFALACGGVVWAGGDLSVNSRHAVRLMPDGTAWTWGLNINGALGRGESWDYLPAPAPVAGLRDVVQVAAGGGHTMFLRRDGTVWQVGVWTAAPQRGWDYRITTPQQIAGVAGIVSIAAGAEFCLAMQNDGTVWAWGGNGHGQHGDGTTSWGYHQDPVRVMGGAVAVAAGTYTSFAVKADGTLWAWGSNDSDLTGGPVRGPQTRPTQVGGLSGVRSVVASQTIAAAVRNDGTVWVWGIGRHSLLGPPYRPVTTQPVQIPGLTGVREISAGAFSLLALLEDGRVWSAGGVLASASRPSNRRVDQAVIPGLENVTAISAGPSVSLAVQANGSMYAWGPNTLSLLNVDGAPMRRTPVRVEGLPQVVTVAAGRDHSIAITAEGAVWGWGENSAGQLGAGHLDPVAGPVEALLPGRVKAAAAAWRSTDLLLEDGTVWRAGANPHTRWPQPGETLEPVAVRIQDLEPVSVIRAAPQKNLALGLGADGGVWRWGSDWGVTPGPGAVRLEQAPEAVAISAGGSHSLALGRDGTVWAWGGSNQYGQLGIGRNEEFVPEAPVRVLYVSGAVDAAAGSTHSLAVRSDGTVWSWGSNSNGELGISSISEGFTPAQVRGLSGVVAVGAGFSHSLALRADGTVWTWGSPLGTPGSLGTGMGRDRVPAPSPWLRNIKAIAAGYAHVLAVDADGAVWAWGEENTGQLGQGGRMMWEDPVESLPFGLPDAMVNLRGPEQMRYGARAVLDATVANHGGGMPERAWAVEIHLSPGLRLVGAGGAGWACGGGEVSLCERAERFMPGASAGLRIEVEAVSETDPKAAPAVSAGVRLVGAGDRYPGNDGAQVAIRVTP